MACTCTCYKEGVPYPCECPCPDENGKASSSTSKIVSTYESKLAACKGDEECIARVQKEEQERLLKERIAKAKEKKEAATATLAATIKAEEEIKASYGKIIPNTTANTARDLQPDVWIITWVECKDGSTCMPYSVTFDNYTAYSDMLGMLTSQTSVIIYESITPTEYINYYASLEDALAACNTYCSPPIDPCDYLNITVNYLSTTEIDQNTGTASITVTWAWEQNQTVSNIPINLYDNAGNVLETVYLTSPESFMFTGLAAGSYTVGVSGNFQIEVNGALVDIRECFTAEAFEIGTEDPVIGCMDQNACNFNPEANTHDSSICEYIDCAGVCGGSATVDECGDCVVGINQGCEEGFPVTGNCVEVACTQDCNGVWGGAGAIDDCGNCTDPNSEEWNAECLDCNGVANGPSMIDACGNCADPTDLTVWNSECQGCKEECALNYDPDAAVGCADCCISFDFIANCICDSTTATPTISVYWYHPQGAYSPVGGPTGGKIVYNTGANYISNSISYTDTQTTVDIPDDTTWTTTQTPEGRWYSYTDIEISSVAGTELPDALYTLTFDSVIVQDSVTGDYLTHEEGVSVKECKLMLCGIESKLQTHFKNIILENKCCQCEELKDTWFKAWTLYRALKIASTCGIESHIPKTIKRINALCNLMSNKICNNC